jgi:hypothetical protein
MPVTRKEVVHGSQARGWLPLPAKRWGGRLYLEKFREQQQDHPSRDTCTNGEDTSCRSVTSRFYRDDIPPIAIRRFSPSSAVLAP